MKLSELYNGLNESKRTEDEALNILMYFHKKINGEYPVIGNSAGDSPTEYKIPSEDFINGEIESLKKIDSTEGKSNLGPMAYFYAQSLWPSQDLINYNHLGEIFNDYNHLFSDGKIGRIEVSPSGVKIIGKGEGEWSDFMDFQEYIHGQKNLYSSKDERSGELVVDMDEEALFDENGIEIYDATDMDKCIKYGYTSQIEAGKIPYSFCISQPKRQNNMYHNYRDRDGSTFYFIFDKNRDESDPLHIVVFDNGSHRIRLTDKNNNTGSIAEYGTDTDGYVEYLKSKGVPVEEMLPNIERSDIEKEEAKFLRNRNSDLVWFQKLSYDYKQKYIGRGHALSDDQLKYILPNKVLASQYLQLGDQIKEENFNLITNNNLKKTYIRARIGYWEGKLKEHYREGFNNEGLGEMKLRPWELAHVPQDKVDLWAKLSIENRWPIYSDELNLVSDGLRMELKDKHYKGLAREGNFWMMLYDSEYSWEKVVELLPIAFDRFHSKITKSHFTRTDDDGNVTWEVTEEQLEYIIKLAIEKGIMIDLNIIPKDLRKSYIEIIAKGGRHIPIAMVDEDYGDGAIPYSQAEIDLYISLVDAYSFMGGNSVEKENFHTVLSKASQPLIDSFLNGYVKSDQGTLPRDFVLLGGPEFQAKYMELIDNKIKEKIKKGREWSDIPTRLIVNANQLYKEKYLDEILDEHLLMMKQWGTKGKNMVGILLETIVKFTEDVLDSVEDTYKDRFFKKIYMALKAVPVKFGKNYEFFKLLKDNPTKWNEKIKELFHPF